MEFMRKRWEAKWRENRVSRGMGGGGGGQEKWARAGTSRSEEGGLLGTVWGEGTFPSSRESVWNRITADNRITDADIQGGERWEVSDSGAQRVKWKRYCECTSLRDLDCSSRSLYLERWEDGRRKKRSNEGCAQCLGPNYTSVNHAICQETQKKQLNILKCLIIYIYQTDVVSCGVFYLHSW